MRRRVIVIISIYTFFYIFNFLTPMGFGDDYLYSFVWQGKPEFIPLTENAVRISSLHDLFVSQWLHYFTWSGRTVNHTIAQLFLWSGKDIFNVFNALAATLLIVEIYCFINDGRLTLYFKTNEILYITFILWAFSPGFVSVFLWLDGACNYLWTTVLLLLFLIPFLRKYYCVSKTPNKGCLFSILMFLCGVLAGWTNENSICCIIIILLYYIFTENDCNEAESWMYSGFAGLMLGYILLMCAPGNIARLHAVYGHNWLNLYTIDKLFIKFMQAFSKVLVFQFLMWYYCLRIYYKLKKAVLFSNEDHRDFVLAKILCIVAFLMSAIMILSPEFPLRSGFPGTVQLIIATGILRKLQKKYIKKEVQKTKRLFLLGICCAYCLMTVVVSVYNLYFLNKQTDRLIAIVTEVKQEAKEDIVIVKPFKKPSRLVNLLSGFHIVENELLEDENSWENIAFARYYGIKGIRVLKEGLSLE